MYSTLWSRSPSNIKLVSVAIRLPEKMLQVEKKQKICSPRPPNPRKPQPLSKKSIGNTVLCIKSTCALFPSAVRVCLDSAWQERRPGATPHTLRVVLQTDLKDSQHIIVNITDGAVWYDAVVFRRTVEIRRGAILDAFINIAVITFEASQLEKRGHPTLNLDVVTKSGGRDFLLDSFF